MRRRQVIRETRPDQAPIDRLLRVFQEFARVEAAGGILLLCGAAIALAWANSPWSATYEQLWQIPVTVGAGGFILSKPLLLWINDGLMAIFFFVVGLEIKREALDGELSSPGQALIPVAAAAGGMVVPAAIYLLLNRGGEASRGWGIPMATDIAFSLGVLALAGSRAPTPLRVFLTAFAIADDIGAVLVIALFYTVEVSGAALGVAAAFMLALGAANALGVRSAVVYGLLGVGLWVAFLNSGVHSTIAGVLLAFSIPTTSRLDAERFLRRGRAVLDQYAEEEVEADEGGQAGGTRALERLAESTVLVQSPLGLMERALHPWVSYGIMPLFALANAGVSLRGVGLAELLHPVPLGIVLGLLVGKSVGVTGSVWLALRFGPGSMPSSVTWPHLYAAGWLGGIGFTMSLFIAGLAFGGTSLLPLAKIGILIASAAAGLAGLGLLRWGPRGSPVCPQGPPDGPEGPDGEPGP